MNKLDIGLDVGSTTVKAVVMNKEKKVLYKNYQRHFSDTKKTIDVLLTDILEQFKDSTFTITLTGSGSIALARFLDVNFVQEVIMLFIRMPKKQMFALN